MDQALHALVMLPDGTTSTHPLPARGSVAIGRSEECDITIADASISRRHAVLHLGPPLTVEDLGSSNGTAVRGTRRGDGGTARMVERRVQRGERADFAQGDMLSLGSAVVVILPGPAAAAPGRKKGGEAAGAEAVLIADPEVKRVHELARRVARGEISVLLLGETGVGKDVLAEAIHRSSPRAAGPFLRLNCAAFTDQLLESELFGHERGAFTGAAQAKPGLLESAKGGTVLLDEVGELTLPTQAKLLRAVEDGQVLPVGGVKPRPIDVRFIAATNRDLEAEVARGTFRRDLYFRLNGVTLLLPPLRERLAEIEPLARAFLARTCARLGRPELSLTAAALEALRSRPWPGNVRELRNLMERAALVCDAAAVGPEHFGEGSTGASAAGPAPDLRSDLESLERQRILAALEACDGNQTQAAKKLGMPRRTLVKRLASYGVTRWPKGE